MYSPYLPRISSINKSFLIISGVCCLFQILLELGGHGLLPFLGLSAAKLFSGHFYQLFTFPFVPHGLLELLFNGLVLWFFGSELENLWGRYRYLQFAVCTLLGQAIFYIILMSAFFSHSILFSYPLSGPSGLCSAICVAYGILFPNRIVYLYLFPVKAKWFVAIIILIGLYQALPSKGGVYAWAQLAAMGSGVSWMWAVSQIPRVNFKDLIPRDWWGLRRSKRRSPHPRPYLKVVHPPPENEHDPSKKTYH